jgi:hypothetical protein
MRGLTAKPKKFFFLVSFFSLLDLFDFVVIRKGRYAEIDLGKRTWEMAIITRSGKFKTNGRGMRSRRKKQPGSAGEQRRRTKRGGRRKAAERTGMAPVIAFTFSAYVNEARFKNGAQAANYLGLMPRVYMSGSLIRYRG